MPWKATCCASIFIKIQKQRWPTYANFTSCHWWGRREYRKQNWGVKKKKKKEDLNLHCNPYFLKKSGTSKTKCWEHGCTDIRLITTCISIMILKATYSLSKCEMANSWVFKIFLLYLRCIQKIMNSWQLFRTCRWTEVNARNKAGSGPFNKVTYAYQCTDTREALEPLSIITI